MDAFEFNCRVIYCLHANTQMVHRHYICVEFLLFKMLQSNVSFTIK